MTEIKREWVERDELRRRQHAEADISLNGEDPSPEMAEEPLPLRRPLPDPEPFPADGLGVLKEAAEAIHDLTQAPMAICGQSVLAVASLVAQAHANVILPTGQPRPTSCYFLTVAASGERKTSCDDLALRPVREHLDQLRLQYDPDLADHRNRLDLWKLDRDQILKGAKAEKAGTEADLRNIGAEPLPPSEPRIICGEPTIEGLFKLLRNGLGFAGIFSAEGGTFVGGHGLNPDNKLKTAAYLSSLWDGTAIDRTRAGDELVVLHGRRVAAHLMVQPGVAERLLSDSELLSQGLLSRVLVTAPTAAAGTRFWREPLPMSRCRPRRLPLAHRVYAHAPAGACGGAAFGADASGVAAVAAGASALAALSRYHRGRDGTGPAARAHRRVRQQAPRTRRALWPPF